MKIHRITKVIGIFNLDTMNVCNIFHGTVNLMLTLEENSDFWQSTIQYLNNLAVEMFQSVLGCLTDIALPRTTMAKKAMVIH